MSYLDTAMSRLFATIDKRLEAMRPFRAYVDGLADGMVTIRRLGETTPEDEPRARMPGLALAVDDEVLCLPVNGKPVVIGPVQRSTPVSYVFDAQVDTGKILTTTASIDLGTLAAGASFQANVALTGCDANDVVALGLPTTFPTLCTATAFVATAGLLRLRVINHSDAALVAGAKDYRFTVLKP